VTMDKMPPAPETRRRLSRQSSSSDTIAPAVGPLTPPENNPGARKGVPFPSAPGMPPRKPSGHTPSGSLSSTGRRLSSSQQATGALSGTTRRPSWNQHQSRPVPPTESKTRDGVPKHRTDFSGGSGASGAESGGGRYFDPATDVDVRKRDTQEVLTRFMKVGTFSQNPSTKE
jgi:hypothetical protein